MREQRIKLPKASSNGEIHYFGSEDIRDDVWKLFKKERPITAHILEEIFGTGEAASYIMYIDDDFTEAQAVRMLAYTFKPKNNNLLQKNGRISNILYDRFED